MSLGHRDRLVAGTHLAAIQVAHSSVGDCFISVFTYNGMRRIPSEHNGHSAHFTKYELKVINGRLSGNVCHCTHSLDALSHTHVYVTYQTQPCLNVEKTVYGHEEH